MRIAIIASGYLPVLDGVSVSVHERVRRLSRDGHSVLLMAPRTKPGPAESGLANVALLGLKSRPVGGVAGDRNPVRAANAAIEAALEGFRPDIIHVEEPERLLAGLWRSAALRFAKARKVPILAFYHTNFIDYADAEWSGLPKPLLRTGQAAAWRVLTRLYNRFDRTLVPSEVTHRRLTGFGLRNGVSGRFNGADLAAFRPTLHSPGYWRTRWRLAIPDHSRTLLILGRLTADKGWAFWREALPALADRCGDAVSILVAGDGPLRAEVEAMLAGLPSGHHLGRVPHAEVGRLLANADIYATASPYENASLAVLEALASGTPVIAPAAGGIPDQVRDGETGLLFPTADVAGFADAVMAMGAGLADFRTRVAASRDAVGWDRAYEAWLSALEAARRRRSR